MHRAAQFHAGEINSHAHPGCGPSAFLLPLLGLLSLPAICAAAPGAPAACQKLILQGEVSAGKQWQAPIGQGWIVRLLPIAPGKAGYSGWDLAVDRVEPAGYPDALLLASPPYNSINERELGTTFGLRAQDAIGWNPRTFRFLTDPDAFRQAQKIFLAASTRDPRQPAARQGDSSSSRALTSLLVFEQNASSGELRILDAHLVPGVIDPAPYARGWARAAARIPYQVDTGAPGPSSQLGSLDWIRFSVTLWLPAPWQIVSGLHVARSTCGQ